MSFFDGSVAPLRRKSLPLVLGDHQEPWHVQFQIGKHRLYSTYYSKIDLACMVWALLLIPMFVTPQFFCVSWTVQAGLWSAISLVGLAAMVGLSQYWVRVERVSWVLYLWVILMLAGLILTDLGIFLAWSWVLANLCSLWLWLVALGYLCTGLAVRSRAILATGFAHLLAIWVLPWVAGWQFLFTGAVMVLSLLVLAEFRWDMLPSCMKK